MKHALKWVTLVLLLAEVALVRFRIINIGTAIGIIVGVELLLALVVSRQVFSAAGAYRRDRQAGLDAWAAAEDGLQVFFPRAVARVLVTEARLWSCLGKCLSRRIPRSEDDFTYHKKSFMWAFLVILLFSTPVEVFLLELFLPWPWLKWLLIIVSVYAFFWVVGLYASLVVLPHSLGGSKAIFSSGIMARAQIAYVDIADVALQRTAEGLRGDGPKVLRGLGIAYLAIGGNTDVILTLRSPVELRQWFGQPAPVRTIHVAADEPERLVRELTRRLVPPDQALEENSAVGREGAAKP